MNPFLPSGRRRLAEWAAVASAYAAGTLVFWWPLPTRLSTHVWGDRFDAWTTLWLIWHLEERVEAGALVATTNRILYPVGYNLWSFGHAALQAIGSALVYAGVPLVLAYNLLLLFGLFSAGLAAHAFGRALSGSHRGGFAAGIVFSTSPYLYGEGSAGCIELVAAGLLPLYAHALLQLSREPTIRRALLAAGALAIIGPFNWYYTLFAGIYGIAFVLWQAVEGRRRAPGLMLASMALAALSNAPLIPLVRRETPSRPSLSAALFTEQAAWDRSRALLDGAVPLDALTPERLEEHDAMQVVQNATSIRSLLVPRFTVNPLGSTPGIVAFAVGGVGAVLARRRGYGWLAIAGGATIFTLGPWMMLDETPPLTKWSATIPLPYEWAYEHLPFFAKAYRPYRLGVIALLALSGGAAAGAAALGKRAWPLLPALWIVAYTQPFWAGDRPARRPLEDASIPAFYEKLRDLPNGAVIELPLQYQPLSIANARFQYNQTVHRKPMLNCNQLIRRTELMAFRDYVSGNRFVAMLLDVARRPQTWTFADADIAAAIKDGFRYLVFHRRVPVPAGLDSEDVSEADFVGQPFIDVLRGLFGAPVVDDPEAWVFAMPGDWTDRGLVHRYSDAHVTRVPVALDYAHLGFPLVVAPDADLPLFHGAARSLSFWARAVGDDPPAVRVTGQPDVAVALEDDAWTWIEVEIASEEPVDIAFAGPGRMDVTRAVVVGR